MMAIDAIIDKEENPGLVTMPFSQSEYQRICEAIKNEHTRIDIRKTAHYSHSKQPSPREHSSFTMTGKEFNRIRKEAINALEPVANMIISKHPLTFVDAKTFISLREEATNALEPVAIQSPQANRLKLESILEDTIQSVMALKTLEDANPPPHYILDIWRAVAASIVLERIQRPSKENPGLVIMAITKHTPINFQPSDPVIIKILCDSMKENIPGYQGEHDATVIQAYRTLYKQVTDNPTVSASELDTILHTTIKTSLLDTSPDTISLDPIIKAIWETIATALVYGRMFLNPTSSPEKADHEQ